MPRRRSRRGSCYDYYTGGPDLSSVGAPTTLPGYGPNTRTIMQVTSPAHPCRHVQLDGAAGGVQAPGERLGRVRVRPTPDHRRAGRLQLGLRHQLRASGWCNAPGSTSTRCDGFARIQEQGNDIFGFNTLKTAYAPGWRRCTIPFEPKGMHDEMNSTIFDEYGRMQANLGLEAPGATPVAAEHHLVPVHEPGDGVRRRASNLPRRTSR